MTTATEESTVLSTPDLHPQIYRRIELYPPKKHYNGITASFGDFPVETLNPSISETGISVPGGGVRVVKAESSTQEKRLVVGEFYEHGFDPELSFRIRFQKIGAGLENLGNTCYLNSVLQCLTYTEPFAAYLQSGKHKSTCRTAGFCAMCALQNHVLDARQSTGKILRPFHLVKNLRCISRNFRNSRQEDAHEYMVNLLESMHKCCLPYGVQSESPNAYEKSQVHKIFGGQLRSQVKCDQCSYCSDKFDPFLDLSLEIMKADTLRKALEHFTAMEVLDGGEKQYQCQLCKERVRAFKQLTIHKAPYVLTIHLKRFGSTIHGEKLSKKVEYGPTLDLNPFVSDPHVEGGYRYTLYGVLVHAGWTTHSGHYFCYVRTSVGIWYSLDDNQVTQVSEKTVFSRQAYMLFYVRDRKFTVKRSIAISAPKPHISATADGNKVAPLIERKPSVAVRSPVKNMKEGFPFKFVPDMCTSSQQSIKNEGLLSHNEDNKHETTSKDPEKSHPSIDSIIPVDDDQKSKITNESAQDSVLAHSLETDHSPHRSDIDVGHLNLNDSIPKEAVGTVMVDNQNDVQANRPFVSSINQQLQKDGDSLLKSLETDSLMLSAAVCSVQQEFPVDVIPKKFLYSFHQTESKLKKHRKASPAKGPYFGRKQLFLMSLHLPKKKHMRSKKYRLTSRYKRNKRIDDDPGTSSHEASTSETFQAIGRESRHLPSKHSHSATSGKLKGSARVKICRSRVHDKLFCTGMNSVSLETSNKPNRFYFTEENTRVKGENDKDAGIQSFSVNSLITSLKETPVARWVDENIQAEQMIEIEENSKRNVGYVLDDWDEDYDKGKRKKVKKSRQWFGVGVYNPFQELVRIKTQHNSNVTVERKSSGDRPFRI